MAVRPCGGALGIYAIACTAQRANGITGSISFEDNGRANGGGGQFEHGDGRFGLGMTAFDNGQQPPDGRRKTKQTSFVGLTGIGAHPVSSDAGAPRPRPISVQRQDQRSISRHRGCPAIKPQPVCACARCGQRREGNR